MVGLFTFGVKFNLRMAPFREKDEPERGGEYPFHSKQKGRPGGRPSIFTEKIVR